MNSFFRTASVALVRFAAIGILAGGATQSLANPVVYNAATEFNNSQGGSTGVWNYGRLDGVGGTFSLATSFDGSNFRGPGDGGYPYVGASFMHPGCVSLGDGTCQADKAFADLRFTAPMAGTYTATFQVKLSDPGNNPFINGGADYRRDGVRMYLGTTYKDLPTWDPATLPNSFTYQTLNQTFTLAAGQSIDFAVDHNGARTCLGCVPVTRYNLYDSTSYLATVSMASAVPAPASIVLLGAGLIGFGLSMGKRRPRTLAAV
jgi:hypothetical protein